MEGGLVGPGPGHQRTGRDTAVAAVEVMAVTGSARVVLVVTGSISQGRASCCRRHRGPLPLVGTGHIDVHFSGSSRSLRMYSILRGGGVAS